MSLVERLSCGYDSATLFVALGYCVTSSLLSIINKARDALRPPHTCPHAFFPSSRCSTSRIPRR